MSNAGDLNGQNQGSDPNINNNMHVSPPILHLPKALQLIRTYDGRSNVDEWISKFTNDTLAFGIPYKYSVVCLDRFLVGDALNWWNSVSHTYDLRDLNNDEDHFINEWNSICADMKVFFNHSSVLSHNRKKNRELVFKLGDDPQTYVTSKLAVLSEIDSKMTDTKKVKNLIRGLSVELQLHFSSQDIDNPTQFLNKLRKYNEILETCKAKQTPSSSHVKSAEPSISSQVAIQGNGHSAKAMKSNGARQAPVVSTNPQANRTCYRCGSRGHISRNCQNGNYNQPAAGYQNPNMHANRFGFGRGYQPRQNYFNNYNFNPYYGYMQRGFAPPFPPQLPPFPNFHYGGPRYFSNNRQFPPAGQRDNLLSITELEGQQNAPPAMPPVPPLALPENNSNNNNAEQGN